MVIIIDLYVGKEQDWINVLAHMYSYRLGPATHRHA